MFRGAALALAVIAGDILMEGAARADDALARASEAVAASDYVAARSALTEARAAGDHSPADTAEMYRLSGVVEAALGNAQAATEAFSCWLALVPRARLPSSTSPRIARPFDAARSTYATRAPLEVKIETRAKPPGLTVVVASDPMHMVATARVVYAVDRGAERTTDVTASPRIDAAPRADIALPAGHRIDARVAALDAHGNRLIEIGSREVPIVIIGEPPPVVAPRPAVRPIPPAAPRPASPHPAVVEGPRPIYLRWWPYAIATVAAGGATAYFGWSAYGMARDLQEVSLDHSALSPEFRSLEDRGQRATLITNIGFGVTGALAVATGVLFLTRPHGAEVRVAAVPMQAGGALVLGGSF
jgi:hypothetical protein